MSYSINKEDIITYPAQQLNLFYSYMFEWIDNLNFTISPFEILKDADAYITVARKMFIEMGWAGDGEIKLMWIPPFMLKRENQLNIQPHIGITIWHVKQKEDGLSWILSPIELPL